MLESNIPDNDLKQVGELDDPVFYPNGSLDRQVFPWKDAISHVVKFFDGREYTISRPRDLWNAVTEVRLTRGKSFTGP